MLAKQFRNRKRVVFESNRSAVIRKLAQRNNYDYSREERPPREWHQLKLFRQHRRLTKNRLRHIGPDHATNILDFGFQTVSKQKCWQTAVVIERYAADFGRVMLTPISLDTTHTTQTVGGSQISSSYTLNCDSQWTDSLLESSELRSCLERNRGWTVEIFSRITCLHRPEFVVDAFAYLDYAASAIEVHQALYNAMQPQTRPRESSV